LAFWWQHEQESSGCSGVFLSETERVREDASGDSDDGEEDELMTEPWGTPHIHEWQEEKLLLHSTRKDRDDKYDLFKLV